jgi:hypothetical protein
MKTVILSPQAKDFWRTGTLSSAGDPSGCGPQGL